MIDIIYLIVNMVPEYYTMFQNALNQHERRSSYLFPLSSGDYFLSGIALSFKVSLHYIEFNFDCTNRLDSCYCY